MFLTVTAFSVLNSWTSTINSCFSAEGGMNSHVRESTEQGSPVTILEKKMDTRIQSTFDMAYVMCLHSKTYGT